MAQSSEVAPGPPGAEPRREGCAEAPNRGEFHPRPRVAFLSSAGSCESLSGVRVCSVDSDPVLMMVTREMHSLVRVDFVTAGPRRGGHPSKLMKRRGCVPSHPGQALGGTGRGRAGRRRGTE